MVKLKSDVIDYGNDFLRIDYVKTKKANGKLYVEVFFIGTDASKIINMDKSESTKRLYDSKDHAQKIVVPIVKKIIHKLNRGVVEMDISKAKSLPAYKDLYVTSLGEENVYFQMDGEEYYVKGKKWDVYFETPKWMSASQFKRLLE